MISRMSSFVEGRAGEDHFFVLDVDGGVVVPLWIPRLATRVGSDRGSSSSSSLSFQFAEGSLDDGLRSGLGLIAGDLGLPGARGSSSSMSNMRSAVESFGRMLGLNGAFRAAFDFRRDFSCVGELAIKSSRLPTLFRKDEDSRLSSP